MYTLIYHCPLTEFPYLVHTLIPMALCSTVLNYSFGVKCWVSNVGGRGGGGGGGSNVGFFKCRGVKFRGSNVVGSNVGGRGQMSGVQMSMVKCPPLREM